MRLVYSLSIIFFFVAHPMLSAQEGIHGRVQLTGQYDTADNESLDAYLGERYRSDAIGDLRLSWAPRWENWDLTMHYQMTADAGDDVRYNRKVASYFGETPPYTWFDLSDDVTEKDELLVQHKIDRMALGYSASNYVIRIGRQALTWGAGKMFQIMDLVGPFAPNTVDTEYKPGVDMLYAQWLFDDGADLQFAAAPRRKVSGGKFDRDASTIALYYRRSSGEYGTTWLLSHNYEYWTAGMGVSGPLRGASWNIEIVPTFDVDGETKISFLTNIDFGVTLVERNATVFLEYYRNGYGQKGDKLIYDTLPDYLLNQISRGQVFNISKNYLSAGINLELTPLLNISSTLISNVDDRSAFATIEANFSLSDDGIVLLGGQLPFGPKNTEYGGVLLSDQANYFVGPTSTLYLQYRHYF